MPNSSDKQTFLERFRRWYVEGLTGELRPDYKKLEAKRKDDLQRLQRSIRESNSRIDKKPIPA